MNSRLLALTVAVAVGCALSTPTPGAEPQLPRDGWTSWEVPAPEGTPFWCCWSNWKQDPAGRESCKLDERANGFGSRRETETTGAVKIYVRTTAGKIDRLKPLAAACPVQTRTPVSELRGISADDSARWLSAQARQDGRDAVTHEPLVNMTLAALSMHGSDLAGRELASFARNDARAEARKWAVFWLAQAAPTNAEDVITQSLRTDKDGDVREHAVFALSLLPDDRSVKALISTAEDRALSREQRKRAVFWLSQSEKDSAQAYLEKVLLGATR